MSYCDEVDLRRRLHEELDLADLGPVPVEAVFRRSRAALRRRLISGACGAIALALLAGVLATGSSARPQGHPHGASAEPNGVNTGSAVFASGRIAGGRWSLSVVNLADRRCLPGVVLNGGSGDLLQGGFLPGLALGNLGFLRPDAGHAAPGWAFAWLRPGVHGASAVLSSGATIDLRPVTVRACGRSFRMTGFAYPAQGVLRITATSASGQRIDYRPPAEISGQASATDDSQWFNVGGGVLAKTTTGLIGSGRTGGTAWRVWASLGPGGECFTAGLNGAGRPPGSASVCRPVAEPPQGAALASLPLATLTWYPGTVNSRTAYAIARLSDGTTRRLTPAVVDGRAYVVLGISTTVRLVRLTLYDEHGRLLGTAHQS